MAEARHVLHVNVQGLAVGKHRGCHRNYDLEYHRGRGGIVVT